MKKHFKIFAILAFVVMSSSVLFIFSKNPGDDKPETIMVKMYRANLLDKAFITVIYGGEKSESNKFSWKEDLDLALLNTIQKLNADGYKVVSESSYTLISGTNGNLNSHENEVVLMTRK